MTSPTEDREIVLTRTVPFPREKVWEVWTDPKHIAVWWGPNGFTNTIHEMTVKPGGVWRFIMHGPDGKDWPNKIIYRVVRKPEYLEYDHTDDDDKVPGHVFRATATFEEKDGKTTVTLRLLFEEANEKRRSVDFGAVEGGNQTLGRLEAYLKNEKIS